MSTVLRYIELIYTNTFYIVAIYITIQSIVAVLYKLHTYLLLYSSSYQVVTNYFH